MSKKLIFNITDTMFEKLIQEAEKRGLQKNDLIRFFISECLEEKHEAKV